MLHPVTSRVIAPIVGAWFSPNPKTKNNNPEQRQSRACSSMRRKSQRFGIKLPNGEVEEVLFSSPSSSGFVFGLTHSSKHITVIDEGNAVSSHATEQDAKRASHHLGRLSKNEMDDESLLKIFRPRKLRENELDQRMMYFTKKLVSSLNVPDDICFKVTDDKSMSYLDFDAIFKYICSFFQHLQRSPDAFFGFCSVRQMLLSENLECGRLGNGKLIVRINKDLYLMDWSLFREALFMQNDSMSENPLLNIMKVLGVASLQESLTERLRELSSKVQ